MAAPMMFWIVAAAMAALVAFPLLRAMAFSNAGLDSQQANVAFFQAQQAEIDRQQASGLMSPEEAKSASAEAARRLLSLSRNNTKDVTEPRTHSRMAAFAIAIAIPLLAIPLYLGLGSPDLPGKPYATRTDLNRNTVELGRLVARLDAHLTEAPDDARGWELAFPVYMRLGRFDSAVDAATRIIALKGETAERQASLAEALISSARGDIQDAAKAAIAKALELDPKMPRARFYSAMLAEQTGDTGKALEILGAIIPDMAEGAEKAAVLAQIERLKAPAGKPNSDALEKLPPGDQAKAIRGMVDGLEARLIQNGGSPDEWLRLVRALTVLGETDRAKSAIASARAALKDNAGALAALEQLAQELPGPK